MGSRVQMARRSLRALLLFVAACIVLPLVSLSQDKDSHVAVIDMRMLILPGTADYLDQSIRISHEQGAKALVVLLDTPGGMLTTSQEMIQAIFKAPIPVIIYVAPTGGSATSAGVFITMAGHVAAMAPGTSIGAAHPVQSDGTDINGDMRKKAENMTTAMVTSIAKQRGRNAEWVEKAVRESSSITEQEALKSGVVDMIASDIDDLLRQSAGKEVDLDGHKHKLEDYSKLPRRHLEISLKQRVVNVLANPTIAALLWLGATTGLSLELYNPGAILPGVVGIICLFLALAVSQVIPISQSGVLLLITGVLLIGAEMFIPSGILGVGGIIAMILGAIYLIDVSVAPDLAVNLFYIVPLACAMGIALLSMAFAVVRSAQRKVTTGAEGLIGQVGSSMMTFDSEGKVFVNGEIWSAVSASGRIEKDSRVVVASVRPGFVLEVRSADANREG